jgi:hypothetical protein
MLWDQAGEINEDMRAATHEYAAEVRRLASSCASQPLNDKQAKEVAILLATVDEDDWADAIGDALTRVDEWVYPASLDFSLDSALARVDPMSSKRIAKAFERLLDVADKPKASVRHVSIGSILYSSKIHPSKLLLLCAMTEGRAAVMVLHQISESDRPVPVHASNCLASTIEKSIDAMIALNQ